MSPDRQATLLAYCRLEAEELTPDEAELLESMYQAAVAYMDQAGVSEPEPGSPRRRQYDLCVNCLTLDAWDRRSMSTSSALTDNPGFRRTLNQLKMTEPISASLNGAVSDSDTAPGSGGDR